MRSEPTPDAAFRPLPPTSGRTPPARAAAQPFGNLLADPAAPPRVQRPSAPPDEPKPAISKAEPARTEPGKAAGQRPQAPRTRGQAANGSPGEPSPQEAAQDKPTAAEPEAAPSGPIVPDAAIVDILKALGAPAADKSDTGEDKPPPQGETSPATPDQTAIAPPPAPPAAVPDAGFPIMAVPDGAAPAATGTDLSAAASDPLLGNGSVPAGRIAAGIRPAGQPASQPAGPDTPAPLSGTPAPDAAALKASASVPGQQAPAAPAAEGARRLDSALQELSAKDAFEPAGGIEAKPGAIPALPFQPAPPLLAGSAPAGPGASVTPPSLGAAAPAPVPLGAVPVEIGLRSMAGADRFEIRLDPQELGRIDVRLDFDGGGGVKAHLVVDRPETLALLQRDARALDRAFEQAGFKPSEGGIDLSLRDPSGGRQEQNQGQDQGRPDGQARPASAQAAPERADMAPVATTRIWRGTTGLDVRI